MKMWTDTIKERCVKNFEIMFIQQWNVFWTVTQRQEFKMKDVYTEIQVIAEGAFFYHFTQIPVCCDDKTNIDRNRCSAADADNFMLLHHAQ